MLSKSLSVALLLVVTAVCGANAQKAPYQLPDSLPPGVTKAMVERGYTLFHGQALCVNCHGEAAGGLLGPNLTDPEWWHAAGSFLSIEKTVRSGIPEDKSLSGEEMPARGGEDLTDAEVTAVAAYVWRVSHPDEKKLPMGVTPELIEKGDKVFHDTGACVDCHGSDATGDEGPNLTDRDWIYARGSYLAIVRQIFTGVPAERSRSGVVMPPRGGSHISDEDVHAVAAYVWVMGHQK